MNKFYTYFLCLLGFLAVMGMSCQKPTMTPTPTNVPTPTLVRKIPTEMPVKIVCIVNTHSLNVRKEPNNHSEILDNLLLGDTIEPLETIKDWIKIKMEGDYGYVNSKYVKCENGN